MSKVLNEQNMKTNKSIVTAVADISSLIRTIRG